MVEIRAENDNVDSFVQLTTLKHVLYEISTIHFHQTPFILHHKKNLQLTMSASQNTIKRHRMKVFSFGAKWGMADILDSQIFMSNIQTFILHCFSAIDSDGVRTLRGGTLCPSAKHYLSSHYNIHSLYGHMEAIVTRKYVAMYFQFMYMCYRTAL